MPTIEVNWLQIKSIYALSQGSIDWLIKPNLLFSWDYSFQGHRLKQFRIPIETLTVFTLGKSTAYKDALDKEFNFRWYSKS